MLSKLEDMMHDADSEKTKSAIRKCINEIERNWKNWFSCSQKENYKMLSENLSEVIDGVSNKISDI